MKPVRSWMCPLLACTMAACFSPELLHNVGDASVSPDNANEHADSAVTPSDDSPVTPNSGPSDKLDLLFVIDNSGSMAEEQKKLAQALPHLITTLTTGNLSPKSVGAPTDFPPVNSLHIGVVSTDMGIYGVESQPSCGRQSFDPTAPDPITAVPRMLIDKPLGDDGILNTSVAVAVSGIYARRASELSSTPVSLVSAPDPSCQQQAAFPAGQRFIDFTKGVSNPDAVAHQFGCIAKLGKNGCGIEQQLDAMLKALTPSTSALSFAAQSKGHGDSENNGFLRPDAILAVVHISDEDDCSVPDNDTSRELFTPVGQGLLTEDINIRCGLNKYADHLHGVNSRYVAGLKALKSPGLVDRIIFAGIVGAPQTTTKVYSGTSELNALLHEPSMAFVPMPVPGSPTTSMPTPACVSKSGDGSASPGRRFVELAKAFGDNGIITSICEDEYNSAMLTLIQRIAKKL
jgi:hypothetical protein